MKKTGLETITLIIIAGDLRSRKFQFACDPRTRPMKDRTREALMNLLGGTLENRWAFDLFGGSGVLAFEAISRGASHAWVWEILKPGARIIEKIALDLGISEQITVLDKDVLRWTEQLTQGLESFELTPEPWVVFCCPPYAMWETQGPELREMLEAWISHAPAGSLFAVELEHRTDLGWLPSLIPWQVRTYAPAQMAIGEVTLGVG